MTSSVRKLSQSCFLSTRSFVLLTPSSMIWVLERSKTCFKNLATAYTNRTSCYGLALLVASTLTSSVHSFCPFALSRSFQLRLSSIAMWNQFLSYFKTTSAHNVFLYYKWFHFSSVIAVRIPNHPPYEPSPLYCLQSMSLWLLPYIRITSR